MDRTWRGGAPSDSKQPRVFSRLRRTPSGLAWRLTPANARKKTRTRVRVFHNESLRLQSPVRA